MERVNARTLFLMFLTTHDLFLFFSLFLCLTVDHSGLVAFVIDAHSLYSLQSSTPLSSLFLLYCTFVQLLLVSCYDDLNTAKIQLYKMVMTLLICVINYAFVKTFFLYRNVGVLVHKSQYGFVYVTTHVQIVSLSISILSFVKIIHQCCT